jgi:hypothetical protein
MRPFLAAGFAAVLCCATLHASIIPILHLDKATVKAFEDYIAEFEKTDVAPFTTSGKLWIDGTGGGRRGTFNEGRTVVDPRRNEDVLNGSIHHSTGMIHIAGGTIDALQRVMEDYQNYPRYFPPDVIKGSGEHMPDSTAADQHFHVSLLLGEATLWIKVGFRCQYDTHYTRLDANRWESRSVSQSIKELEDPGNPNSGTFPEGDDHGFLWKTNTYWFARQSSGGLDVEANSITLSRPSPPGFGWYGTKRTHDTVDKLLHDVKSAMMRGR